MADDFLIETTNESGGVEQERVSLNRTELADLGNRSLVRIDGLERATTLQKLYVSRPIKRISVAESHALSLFRSAVQQLLRRRACVCARVDTAHDSPSESLSPLVFRCRC
jgi:hypothetical protein